MTKTPGGGGEKINKPAVEKRTGPKKGPEAPAAKPEAKKDNREKVNKAVDAAKQKKLRGVERVREAKGTPKDIEDEEQAGERLVQGTQAAARRRKPVKKAEGVDAAALAKQLELREKAARIERRRTAKQAEGNLNKIMARWAGVDNKRLRDAGLLTLSIEAKALLRVLNDNTRALTPETVTELRATIDSTLAEMETKTEGLKDGTPEPGEPKDGSKSKGKKKAGKEGAPAPKEKGPNEAEVKRSLEDLREMRRQMGIFVGIVDKAEAGLLGDISNFRTRLDQAWVSVSGMLDEVGKGNEVSAQDFREASGKVAAMKLESDALLKRIAEHKIGSAPAEIPKPAETPKQSLDDALRIELLTAEQKQNIKALLERPESVREVISTKFKTLRMIELEALRRNEAGYAEYEAFTKKKIEDLRPQVFQGLEDLMAQDADKRLPTAAAMLEKKIAMLNAGFAAAEAFFSNEQKFPPRQPEAPVEDPDSLRARDNYINKANGLRVHSKALNRLYGSKWERMKSWFGKEGASPQKVVDRVTEAHPLLKKGERLSDLTLQEKDARRKEFVKALQAKGMIGYEAEAVYEAALAKAEYQGSLAGLANSMMDSERQRTIKDMERILGEPFEKWSQDSKDALEQNMAVYKARNVVDRVVIQEQKMLADAQVESLPPKKKGWVKKGLDWYMGLSRGQKLVVSTLFGLSITALGGGIGSLAAAGAYVGNRMLRSTIAMPVMFGIAKAHDYVVKKGGYIEKAEQKLAQSVEEMRRDFSADNIDKFQRAYGDAMEARKMTDRKILASKITVTAAAGFLTAYGASRANISMEGLANRFAGAPTGPMDVSPVPGAGHLPHPEHHPMMPSHGPTAGPENLTPETGPNDLIVEVKPGDNLWNLLKQKLESHGAFKGLSPEEQNRMIWRIEREADSAYMKELVGIKKDINLIYPGQHLNLAPLLEDSNVPGVSEHFPMHGPVGGPLDHHDLPPKTGGSGAAETTAAGPKAGNGPDIHEPPAGKGGDHSQPPVEKPAGTTNGTEQAAATGPVRPQGGIESLPQVEYHGPYASADAMTKLWMMQHPGETPPAFSVREWANLRSQGVHLEDTDLFKSELRFRTEGVLKDIFGPQGFRSHEFETFNKTYTAEDMFRMPDDVRGAASLNHLKDYLNHLASDPDVGPPQMINGQPETLEHYILRGETDSLLERIQPHGYAASEDVLQQRLNAGSPRPGYGRYGGDPDALRQRLNPGRATYENRSWRGGPDEHIEERLRAGRGRHFYRRGGGDEDAFRQRLDANR